MQWVVLSFSTGIIQFWLFFEELVNYENFQKDESLSSHILVCLIDDLWSHRLQNGRWYSWSSVFNLSRHLFVFAPIKWQITGFKLQKSQFCYFYRVKTFLQRWRTMLDIFLTSEYSIEISNNGYLYINAKIGLKLANTVPKRAPILRNFIVRASRLKMRQPIFEWQYHV